MITNETEPRKENSQKNESGKNKKNARCLLSCKKDPGAAP